MDIHITVLNYNGIGLLRKYLSSVVEAAERCSYNARITVLDNGSTDGSLEYIRKNFPSVHTVKSPSNLLLVSYNSFLRTINERIVILLNNDIKLEADCIDYLVPYFNDSSVFFVAPKVMDIEGRGVDGGCMEFSFRAGLFRNKLKTGGDNRYSLFIGSSAAYDRSKFLELGGYDSLYLPGTYEDLDICYRAWQRGWTGIYEERAVAYHEGSASFNDRYGTRKRQKISARNAYLFVWKNIHDAGILTENIINYPLSMFFNILRLRFELVSGSLEALSFLPEVLRRRAECKSKVLRTDRDIQRLLSGKTQK